MPKKQLNGITLCWKEKGDGLPIVLLHPFPLDHRAWEEQTRELKKQCRVITPDFRGFGGSSLDGPLTTMESLAEDVCALLDELSLDRVVLGGLSMGGYVAFAFCRKYSSRVRGLILADTRPQADDENARRARQQLAGLAEKDGSGAVGSSLVPRLFSENTFRLKPQLPVLVWRQIESATPEGISAAARGMALRNDSSDLLPRIQIPTLVIVGEDDALTPPAIARQMAEAIPDASLEVIPRAGHLSNLEEPKAFNAAVVEFLDCFPR